MTATESTPELKSCANCAAILSDRYCARCGQDSHATRTVGHFLGEFVEGITHFDSTFWRTFLLLLFRPGSTGSIAASGRCTWRTSFSSCIFSRSTFSPVHWRC
jgi:hypothetical protein